MLTQVPIGEETPQSSRCELDPGSGPAEPPSESVAVRRGELRALFTLVLLHVARGEREGSAPPAHSTATVPKSYPGIEMRSMGCPSTRSMVRTMAISSGAMNVKASPLAAARPVRPMRCT